MGETLDYRDVECARCRLLSRRFNSPLLNPRQAYLCDHCGANMSTGRRAIVDLVRQVMLHGTVYFFSALIGVFIAMVVFMLGGFLLLGPYYDRVRPLLYAMMWVVGMGGGIAVAERSRRKKLAAAQAPSVPVDAAVRSAVLKQGGRQRALTIGFLLAFVQAPFVVNFFQWIGSPQAGSIVAGLLWVACLAGGWIWGRTRYPNT